jgi:hypothetical protein
MGPPSGKRKRSSASPAVGLRSDSEQAVVSFTVRERDGMNQRGARRRGDHAISELGRFRLVNVVRGGKRPDLTEELGDYRTSRLMPYHEA